jgi:hypothetical protein
VLALMIIDENREEFGFLPAGVAAPVAPEGPRDFVDLKQRRK